MHALITKSFLDTEFSLNSLGIGKKKKKGGVTTHQHAL